MVGHLTPRERQCLALVAAGETNDQIARDLGVTRDTVNSHLVRAYLRLGVEGAGNPRVVAAIMWAKEGREEGR